jgi:hypothetical protein
VQGPKLHQGRHAAAIAAIELREILHRLFHVAGPELAGAVLFERVPLSRRDLIALDGVRAHAQPQGVVRQVFGALNRGRYAGTTA